MNFKNYRTLYKKMSLDLSQSFFAYFITYIILYGLILIGLLYWNVHIIMYIYTFFYILIFILNLKAESVEGKGEFLLLKFVSYLPIEPSYLYFYSYLQRIWFNFLFIFDLIIPCLMFYLFGIPALDILIFFLRIHLLVLTILYIHYVIFWVQRIKNMKIYLKILAILILSILPFVPYNTNVSLTSNLILYFDVLLLVVFLISLFTYRPILDQVLHLNKSTGSKKITIFTRKISRFIFYPLKCFPKIYSILSIYYAKNWRNSSLNDQYVTVIMIMLLFFFVTSFTTLRNDLQLVNTMSFVLCLNVFHRIKCSYTLKESISPEYIPLHFRTKQVIMDIFHFVNVFFIWILLLLLLSLQQPFSISTIFKGFTLFLCYFLITSLFTIPVQHKWYSKEKIQAIKKEIGRKSFFLAIFMIFLSFIFESIINNLPLIFLLIFPILFYLYFLLINKKSKEETFENS